MQNTADHDIVIRRGKPEDANDFSRLVLHTMPRFFLYIFGHKVRGLIAKVFRHRNNDFSFEHSYFIEVRGKIAGMAALYDYGQKKKQDLRTTLLFIKYMGWNVFARGIGLLRAKKEMKVAKDEFKLSYIALYPKFRGLGFGRALLDKIEEEARKKKAKRIVLRTDVDNERAINLYEKCGYKILRRMPPLRVRDKKFHFFAINKELEEAAHAG